MNSQIFLLSSSLPHPSLSNFLPNHFPIDSFDCRWSMLFNGACMLCAKQSEALNANERINEEKKSAKTSECQASSLKSPKLPFFKFSTFHARKSVQISRIHRLGMFGTTILVYDTCNNVFNSSSYHPFFYLPPAINMHSNNLIWIWFTPSHYSHFNNGKNQKRIGSGAAHPMWSE